MLKWETAAVDSFVAMPIGDSVKESIKLLSERRARKRGADCVTPADLDPVKRLYFKAVPEAKRNLEYEKRIAEGETDLRERMALSARAILAREILLRASPLRRGRWLFFLVVCVCLAFSAFYELIEWFAALAGGSEAESFLGTQGDVWDTQWDMFLALLGACASLLLLGRTHDRSLERIRTTPR